MPAFLVLDPLFNLPIPAGFCMDGCNSSWGGHPSFLHLIARKGRHENPVFPMFLKQHPFVCRHGLNFLMLLYRYDVIEDR